MTISQFPADRRLTDIRRYATRLEELNGEDANTFWRLEMTDFVASMRKSGAEDEQIRQQAGFFLRAFQMELERRFGYQTNTGR